MVKVNVTASCIAFGCTEDGANCPVARAIRVCLPDAVTVDVGEENVYLAHTWHDRAFVALPKKVRKFIGAFDKGLEVRPFSFTLNVPKEFLT